MTKDKSLLFSGQLRQEISYAPSWYMVEQFLDVSHLNLFWYATYMSVQNHWSNESTMVDYLDKILFSYITRKRKELILSNTQPASVIYGTFRGQCTEAMLWKLDISMFT